MNTNSIIAIILAILALIAGGYWYFLQGSTGENIEDVSGEPSTSVGQKFADLLGMGKSLECTFEYNDGTNSSSGTVYVTEDGERVRSDIKFTQSASGPMEMHMVRVDGYNYLWGSTMPQGIKRQATAENYAEVFGGDDVALSAMSDTAQYTCVAWSIDSNKFTVPNNVTFMDIGDLNKMIGAPKIGEATVNGSATIDVKAMQCGACDQAGAAREQCREALGCN